MRDKILIINPFLAKVNFVAGFRPITTVPYSDVDSCFVQKGQMQAASPEGVVGVCPLL